MGPFDATSRALLGIGFVGSPARCASPIDLRRCHLGHNLRQEGQVLGVVVAKRDKHPLKCKGPKSLMT